MEIFIKTLIKAVFPDLVVAKMAAFIYKTRRAVLLIRRVVFKSRLVPTSLTVELTNHCNAGCVFCPQPEIMSRTKGRLRDDVFDRLLEVIAEHKIKNVMLGGMGEPFLDKRILGKVRAMSDAGAQVEVTTNGSLVRLHKPKDIVESGLSLISVSMDALTDGYLGEIKPIIKSSVSDMEDALRKLHEYKNENGFKTPRVLCRYQVSENSNNMQDKIAEIEMMNARIEICDEVVIRKPHNWLGDLDWLSTDQQEYDYDTKQRSTLSNTCNYYTNTLNVNWNGDCSLCCQDYDSTVILGNVLSDSVTDIFNHPELDRSRSMFLRGNIMEHRLCQGCYSAK